MAEVSRYRTQILAITKVENIWHVLDRTNGKRERFIVDEHGNVAFNSCTPDFHYKEAFEEILKNMPGVKLCVICKKNSSKDRLMKAMPTFRKVPTVGVSMRMYYSK